MTKEEILKSCEEFDKSLESGGFKWKRLSFGTYQVSEDNEIDSNRVYIFLSFVKKSNGSPQWYLSAYKYDFSDFSIGAMSAKDATASAIALCLGNAKRHLKNLTSVIDKAPHIKIGNELRKEIK